MTKASSETPAPDQLQMQLDLANAVVTPGSSGRLRGYAGIKLVVDWAAALVLLVLSAPLIAALGVLLKLTSEGPAFYTQERLGRRGQPFRIYKLRTMTHQCEAAIGPVWSIADDPRVTRVGQWLRDTHLDELPQLWNVLRGEMSLIGPRPERPELAATIERWLPEFRDRLMVRPGITGLAQMRMPADSNLHTVRLKLEHDRQYIRELGPRIDAMIVLSTVMHFVGRGALKVSLGLTERFAPPPLAEPPCALPDLDLTVAAHPVGRLHIVRESDDLWHAA